MERRTLIAVLLAFLVVYGYQTFLAPPPQEPSATAAKKAEASAGQATAVAAASSPTVPAPAALVGEAAERDVVVETDAVRAVFTNRGARLKHWVLKGYLDSAGRSVDLVPEGDAYPLPFSLRVDEGGIGQALNASLFRVEQEKTDAGVTLTFVFESAAGVKAKKLFRFGPNPYELALTATVTQGERPLLPIIQWGAGLGDLRSTGGGKFLRSSAVPPPDALYHDGESVERMAHGAVGEGAVREGAFRFVGIDDHYFIAAAVNPGQARVEYRAVNNPLKGEATQERYLLLHSIRPAAAGATLRYYIGPKSFDVLKAMDPELVRAINFGMWGFISVPFLSALKWFHGFAGNWGWAIILLTVVMNLVMSPLRHKSVVSMRKMQELQPQLKAIQDRYSDLKVTDPARQKMNTEVMNLYREKGVNPASGCIPMVLQFPFLFAFYSLLSQAIELRGAPFAFWIKDLSLMDPYYVTPLLMGATMVWQQRLTPSTGDPAQQRMMMFMPVVFVGMFLTFPSGLAIYYLVQNVWAIGQQYFTNWMIGPPQIQAPRPAAERRIKSAGAGKTERAEKK